MTPDVIARWRQDPVAFVEDVLVDPETGEPFALYEAQRVFLRAAFTLTPEGRLPYPEVVFSAPKKSGKTALAAMALLYVVVVLGGPYAEGYCVANDFDQAQGRVFRAAARIVEASPLLRDGARVLSDRIEFPATGASIVALASDYAGAAGANPTVVAFDELWAYTSERAHRLWDEMVPPPTRRVAVRLSVTYAGFEGESDLLEGLYRRGLQGQEIAPRLFAQPGLLMAWHHERPAPWQTPEWLTQMRQQLRPVAYARMIENRFVTSESSFLELAWWDACVDPAGRPVVADPDLAVYLGVDASVSRDSTAIVACAWDRESRRVRLVNHRVFQPSAGAPLEFEGTIEATLLDWQRRYAIRAVRYDPYQMVALAQRLEQQGLPMEPFPQTVPNLTEAASNLYELVKGRNLVVYPDDALRLAVSRAVAIESARGWRIAKDKQAHRIDVVVALAMAALATVREGTRPPLELWTFGDPVPVWR